MDKLLIALLFSLLLPQVLFSQIQWSSKNALGRSTSECAVADFDGDGFNDIAVAGATQRWYKGPTFTNFYTIGTSDGGPYAARAADVNGDGWPDFVTSDGARNTGDIPGEIYLYLNPGAAGGHTNPWTRITVYSGNVRHQNDMRLVDMDGDGRLDIIERTWSSERVVVALQNANINTWTVRTFDTGETGKPEGISAGDVDGDGENEIILSGVYWDNPGGWRTGNPVQYPIDVNFVQEEVKSAVGDIDNDGDNDVYMGSPEGAFVYLAWYENTGLNPSGGVNFTKHIIKDNFGKCHMVELIDIDKDGDLDLCTGQSFGEDGCLIFYNNNNGASWTEQDFDPSGNFYTGIIADLDMDGDLDAVGPSGFYDPVYYYYNQTPGSPPDAPTNISLSLLNGLEVSLDWTDVADNEGSYEIQRLENGIWQNLPNQPANTNSFLDQTTQPGTSYQYRVRAANVVGSSAWLVSNAIMTWSQAGSVSLNPTGGNYLSAQTVSIIAASPYDEIRYTLDGSTPNGSSLLYATPLQIAQSTTLKAIALGTNLIPSAVDSARYNIAINGNFAPSANAGPDQSVFTTSVVQLDGSGTSDLDDPIGSLTIAWTQLGGPSVSLSDANSLTPDFVANLASDYEFELSVADEVATDKDTVLIKVSDFDPDLMAYWPMDEANGSTASELVNSLGAQLGIGTSWSPTDGQIQGSLSFDGTSGRAEAPAIDPSGDEMTINFWMKASSLANVEARMISKASGTSGDDHYWMLSQNGGSALRFRLKTDNGGTATLISATGQIAAGNWYMVSAVYDGTEMRLYKDGVEIASLAKSGNISANNSILTGIGNQPSGAGDRPFAGQLDEVRIYDRALSQGEIVALYNEASTVFGVEWGYFVVDAEPSINLLRWQSLSETNTSYYAIERRAESDSVFAELGRVPAAGFSQQPLVYGWQDESPLRGTSFYRLRQVDQDLRTSYSVEISVRRSRSPKLLVYPNPFGNQLTVRSNYAEAGSLELIDQTGRSVWRSQHKQQTQIQLSHLSTGIYQLVLRDQQGQYLTSTTCLRW